MRMRNGVTICALSAVLVAAPAVLGQTTTTSTTTTTTTKGSTTSAQHQHGSQTGAAANRSSTGTTHASTTGIENSASSGRPTTTTTGMTDTTATTTTTSTRRHTTTRHTTSMSSSSRVTADLGRLRAILADFTNTNHTFPDSVVKQTANEAFMLANRISARSKSDAARELRTHVKEMRDAANSGDAAGAASHANMALPFAAQLADSMMKTNG